MYCGKCGSEIDKKTGLCPNCDAAALEKVQEVNTKKLLKKAKRRGVTAIIALILIIAIVVSSVVFAFSKGWIGNNSEEEKKKVQTTYVTYLNKTIISEIGEYDSDHPESSNEGLHSALFCDLNNDDKEEFIVAYSKENGNNIDFNISCYEYDEETKDPENAEENVELIGTVTPSTEPDYTDSSEDVFHFSNQTIVYSIVYNDKTYIVCEHLSWLNEFNYECHVYTVENGKFIEVSNIFRERFGTSGAEYVYSKLLPDEMKINNDDFDFSLAAYMNEMKHGFYDNDYPILFYQDSGEDGYDYIYDTYFDTANAAVCEFLKGYGIIKNNYIDDNIMRISDPDESDLIFSYLYYREYDEDGNEIEKYEINDYTDWKSLLNSDDSINESADTTDKEFNLTEEDCKLFEDMLNCTSWIWYLNGDLDINKITLEELIERFIILDSMPCGMYTNFWEIPESDYIDVQDPKNKFSGCYKLNADNVDWIIKNVFGLIPDRDISSNNFYYDGDSLYRSSDLGGGADTIFKIISTKKIDNQKVGFTVQCKENIDGGYDWYQYFIAELKNDAVMGKYWSIYASSRNSLIIENNDYESADSENISINDLTKKYKNAYDFYSFYIYGNSQYQDFDKTIKSGELVLTEYGEIDTYSEFLTEAEKYFTEDVAADLLKKVEAQDYNGKLYTKINGGVGGAECEESIEISKLNNVTYQVKSTYEWYFDGDDLPTVKDKNFVFENNKWVLDNADFICGALNIEL